MKRNIEEAIAKMDYVGAMQLIKQYETVHPKDFDLLSYYISCYLLQEDVDRALECAKRAVRINPFDVEANYNFAICSELAGNVADAYDYFIRTFFLQDKFNTVLVPMDELNERVNSLAEMAKENADIQNALRARDDRYVYAVRDPFKNFNFPMIGTVITDTNGQAYYVGRCDGWFEAYYEHERNRDSFTAKCEIFPIERCSDRFEVDTVEKVLVPVVLNWNIDEKERNYIVDTGYSTDKAYFENSYCKYSFLPAAGQTTFLTGRTAVFGRPVPLSVKKGNGHKRLVLNIFVDSFNQWIIQKYGLEAIMPNTAKYFSKGMMCDHYYSCSEYTLPSIATYWTGKHPSRHMNLENSFRWDFMSGEKNFAEYFKEAGYVTGKIGGNDSVTPTQDYIRGFDRFVWQINSEGLTVKEIVSDAIEHIETFKDTNQFVWLDIVDPHHVAGGFMRSLRVQSQTPLADRVIDNEIQSTVKQSRSLNREKIYLKELGKIDLYLSMLYDYIEKNYSDDEIVISFFSDHGTAFMVDDDEPFASHQRTNVPLMIRAEGVPAGVCNEIIETADYAGIMCRLSGIEYDYSGKDANLPAVFGGKHVREYALSQSLFLGDPYQAGIHGKNFHCYYKTDKVMEAGFKIDVEKHQIWAVDDEGNDISAQTDLDRYEEIIMDEIAHLVRY